MYTDTEMLQEVVVVLVCILIFVETEDVRFL